MFKKHIVKTSTNQAKLQIKPIPKNKKLTKPPVNIFGMVFFLTLGLVFILNILNIIPLTVWSVIWRFWPLFILMLLLQLFSKKSRFIRLATSGIGTGIIVSIIFFSLASVNQVANKLLRQFSPKVNYVRNYMGINLGQKISSQSLIKASDYDNPEIRNIKTLIGLGNVNITDSESDDYFSSESNYYENFGKPNLTSSLEGSLLNIYFETSQNIVLLLGSPEGLNYNISIGQPNLPTKLNIGTQAGLVDTSLNDLILDELSFLITAGTVNAKIGKKSLPKKINIKVGVGTLKLNLPYDAFAEVKYAVGVGKLKVDNKNLIATGTYTTPKFRITENPISINIKLGTGVVTISTTIQTD